MEVWFYTKSVEKIILKELGEIILNVYLLFMLEYFILIIVIKFSKDNFLLDVNQCL